jgi:hypothetical protein
MSALSALLDGMPASPSFECASNPSAPSAPSLTACLHRPRLNARQTPQTRLRSPLQAGFDAWMTGAVFAKLMGLFQAQQAQQGRALDDPQALLQAVAQFKYRMNLTRYAHVAGRDCMDGAVP